MRSIDELKKAFSKALEIGMDSNFESLEYRKIPEWDSLGHMHLVEALETNFDIMLQTDDVLNMSTFQKAREILLTHGVEFAD